MEKKKALKATTMAKIQSTSAESHKHISPLAAGAEGMFQVQCIYLLLPECLQSCNPEILQS